MAKGRSRLSGSGKRSVFPWGGEPFIFCIMFHGGLPAGDMGSTIFAMTRRSSGNFRPNCERFRRTDFFRILLSRAVRPELIFRLAIIA